jgi:hypothetical protein
MLRKIDIDLRKISTNSAIVRRVPPQSREHMDPYDMRTSDPRRQLTPRKSFVLGTISTPLITIGHKQPNPDSLAVLAHGP